MYCASLQCPDFLQCGVHAEYREGITTCKTCGATLVSELPDPTGEPRLVTLASFHFRQDAELAASMLRANGIDAIIAGDDCGTVDPALGFGTRTRVIVNASQATAASALLEPPAPGSNEGGV